MTKNKQKVYLILGQKYNGDKILKKFKGDNAKNRANAFLNGLKYCTESQLCELYKKIKIKNANREIKKNKG